MCGICGFNWDDQVLLKKMMSILTHRGPDDAGYYTDESVSLGHTRLSIIDLSEKGRQPIHNEDESIWITYNGEIYNFKELRKDLEKTGHRFYSNTDTEVIVHSYEEYGQDCIRKFNGCFAFAIWDSNKKELFLARDRIGIKPLYYFYKEGRFIFSSEIKAILLYEEFVRKVNTQALHDFLTFRFVPDPNTLFSGVKKLSPGHTITIKNQELLKKRYWDLNFHETDTAKSKEYYMQTTLKLLENSVERRLTSDVPLGVFLSGGIDSSSIVAFMSKLKDEPVKTFSIGFTDAGKFDESKHARLVAETFGTDHHEYYIDSKSVEILPQVTWHLEEPAADIATVPTYILSKNAKKYVKVVLNGEGGDETFGGYDKYRVMLKIDKYRKYYPESLGKNIVPKVLNLSPKINLINRLSDLSKNMDDENECYHTLVAAFTENEKMDLYQEKYLIENNGLDASTNITKQFFGQQEQNKLGLLDKMMQLDLKHLLPDDYLMKADRMTMANGLEARLPLLDHLLVEFAAAIPQELKIEGNTGKYILREAMKSILPKEIVKRKKQGFVVPTNKWITEELKDIAMNVLSESNLNKSDYFNPEYIEHILKHYKKSQTYYNRQFWSLFGFVIWHRVYIDGDNISNPRLSLNDLY